MMDKDDWLEMDVFHARFQFPCYKCGEQKAHCEKHPEKGLYRVVCLCGMVWMFDEHGMDMEASDYRECDCKEPKAQKKPRKKKSTAKISLRIQSIKWIPDEEHIAAKYKESGVAYISRLGETLRVVTHKTNNSYKEPEIEEGD